MIALRIPTHMFLALRAAFHLAAEDSSISPAVLDGVRAALTEAGTAAISGLPVLLTLQSPVELEALQMCFWIGGEASPLMSTDTWDELNALMNHAGQPST